jgi:mannose-6-phosphate isomerase
MYRLKGRIQHYSWGGKAFLPVLLNQVNSDEIPFAEYWLGVHPGGPGQVYLGDRATTTLNNLIGSDKFRHLGFETITAFNELPFLLKILDVKDMLSIQVHPTKAMAELGYTEEEQKGISLSAPNRNYKDQNHKPEVMIALSDFWLLHGFSSNIEERLNRFSFLNSFVPEFQSGGIKGLFEHLLSLPQEKANEIISKQAKQIVPLYQTGQLEKDSPDFWAARAILNLCSEEQYDKGIFSIYLMNILNLKKGEGIFQGAGILHAYLEGQNIELMANSDNVLRAGLTNKHIDIPELLAQTSFVVTNPVIIKEVLNNNFCDYPCDTNDFQIQKVIIQSGKEQVLNYNGPSIALVLTGEAEWVGNFKFQSAGLESVFIDPMEEVLIKAKTTIEVFIATVPV